MGLVGTAHISFVCFGTVILRLLRLLAAIPTTESRMIDPRSKVVRRARHAVVTRRRGPPTHDAATSLRRSWSAIRRGAGVEL